MSRAYHGAVLDARLADVWAVLGDFHGMAAWVRMIRTSQPEGGTGRGPVGSVRRLTLNPEGETAERLVRHDDTDHSYSYEFAGPPPFPVRAYRGTVRLRPITESDRTFLEWYGEFDAEEAVTEQLTATFLGIYGEFVADLRAHLAGARTDPAVAR